MDGSTIGDPLRNKVFHDLRLGVDGHRPAAGERAEVDVVALAGELQVDAAVLEALAVEATGQARLAEQPDAAVLEDARALPGLAIGAAADLHDHRLDAAERQEVRQQQPRRAGADDAYLRAHVPSFVRNAPAWLTYPRLES